MKTNFKLIILGLGLFTWIAFSCIGGESSTENENNQANDSVNVDESKVDYESKQQLAKFDTRHYRISDTVSYYSEIDKIYRLDDINYYLLDSLFKTGTDINETFVTESGGGGFGLGFSFSVKGGLSKSSGSGASNTSETTAIQIAISAYNLLCHDENSTQKCFDLIHFLLSRGVNPNIEGKEPLSNYIYLTSTFFSMDKIKITQLIDLYKFYGFDMKNLDLAVSNNNEELLEYLIDEGATNFDMSFLDYKPDMHPIYNKRDDLIEKGVIFDFSKVTGRTFPFDSDSSNLRMFLEMGLSPYHITPEGKDLRSDFDMFSEKSMVKVIDQYRLDHPDQK